jgi:hypothetical protein
MIFGHNIAQIVRCAARFSLADHLADGPVSAERIAQAEKLDVSATFRLMRACTSLGLMTYDETKGFSATALLNTLRKDDPRSLPALTMVQAGHGHWAPWGQLDEAIRAGECQTKATLGSSLWEYYATAAGAEEADAFTQAVSGVTSAVVPEGRCCMDRRVGRETPNPICVRPTRTGSGRPNFSIRFRT